MQQAEAGFQVFAAVGDAHDQPRIGVRVDADQALQQLVAGAAQYPLARYVRDNLDQSSRRHGLLVESLLGAETLKALRAEGVMQGRYETASAAAAASAMRGRWLTHLVLNVCVATQSLATVIMVIWGAYLIRAIMQWSLGLITFWTTRVNAIFEAWYLSELLLSGRLFPLQLMPHWAQRLSWFLPFRWTFGFPITALTGPITTRELLVGLGMQLLWIGVAIGVVQLVWRRAVGRFSSVGG